MYGYIIIGSGFGGSVYALRLAEKGYRFWFWKRTNVIVLQISHVLIGILEKNEWATPQLMARGLFRCPNYRSYSGRSRDGRQPGKRRCELYGEIYGYPNLYVVNGFNVLVNLGVNPSLTITAVTEQIMSRTPIKRKQMISQTGPCNKKPLNLLAKFKGHLLQPEGRSFLVNGKPAQCEPY